MAVPARQAIVVIRFAGGEERRHHAVAVRGTPENPMTEAEVEAKVLDLVAPLLGEGAQALLAAVRSIENRQVRDLRPLLYTNELPESHP